MEIPQDIKSALWPLALPFLACLALFIISQVLFGQARNIEVPPAPETLFAERVRLDTVSHTRERIRIPGPLDGTTRPVRLAQSNDWPGITFRFDGLAAGVSIQPPVTFDLYVSRSLAEAAETHRQFPNVFPALTVYGVADGAEVLVDPAAHHERAASRQHQQRLFAWGALALCLLPGYLLFHQVRGLWREHMA